jgi:putative transposase
MDTPSAPPTYKNHRVPVEIISHAVWLYFRLCSRFRERGELLRERGRKGTYEAIRKWGRKCGQPYAHQLRRRRPRPVLETMPVRVILHEQTALFGAARCAVLQG